MQLRNLVFFGLGLVVGGVLVFVLRGCPKAPGNLVDGKYLVVECPSGHWVYEASATGLKLVAKELSPEGLTAIWELQGAYQPKSILSGTEEILHLPNTRYSTETGSFQVVHKFYRMKDDKLVEIHMDNLAESK